MLSSLLQTLSFPVAGPLPAWRAALAWLALAPLLWLLLPTKALPVSKAAGIGYASGVLWYLGTCYWVYATMHVYGGLPPSMSLLALFLMCLYLGLYHALFAALVALSARLGRVAALVAVPVLWVAVELARARVTSFPWNLLGYAQVDNSILTQLAPVTGVYGISFVLVAVNAALAAVLVLPRRRLPARIVMVAAVLAAALQNAGMSMQSRIQMGTQKAVLLQPNLAVGSGEALNAGTLSASSSLLSLQASAMDDAPTRVVLWPESPSPFQTDRPEFSGTVGRLAEQLGSPVIAGAVGIQRSVIPGRDASVYNSAVLFTPSSGLTSSYNKIHLVPFGEFVPYADLFRFASGLTQAVGTFNRGTERKPLAADGHRYGVFLCYESIFGDEVRRFVDDGADVLVNLSDDGWYGDSSAPFQHINMARMRAIENRRWLLRDTNNGITASINPNGRVVEAMPRNRRGAVAVHFDYLTEKTFYTRHGDVFAYGCTLLSVLVAGASLLRRNHEAVN
ncbi:MAG: apolipoprotein N-acyltransferase [Janthinobacterium lividum]